MTKKRTGSDAFVGLPDFDKNSNTQNSQKQNQKDKSLILKKVAGITGILTIGLATIAQSVNPKKIGKLLNFKNGEFIKAIEFNGQWPGTKQLALIYMTTIAGRILASRDKNELRETATRDYTGFLNWLVLGGFVSKIVGNACSEGKLMNGKGVSKDAPLWKKITNPIFNQSLKSHDEIISLGLKNERQMLNKLNLSLGAGLLYSTVMLGFLMPLLNKANTERIVKKEKEKLKSVENSDNQSNAANNQQSSQVESKNILLYNQTVKNIDSKILDSFAKFKTQSSN